MTPTSIPIQVHPEQVLEDARTKPIWIPGELIGKYQRWLRLWAREDAQVTTGPIGSSLPVYALPCLYKRGLTWKGFPEPTFDTRSAPIGKRGAYVDVRTTAEENLHAVLAWSESGKLELELAAKLEPDHVRAEQHGTAWLLYTAMETGDERLARETRAFQAAQAAEVENRFLKTTDIVTGEVIRTLPFTGTDKQTGNTVMRQLETAWKTAKEGTLVDITSPVVLCDSMGPVKYFKTVFSPDELPRLKSADAALAEKAFFEFMRHGYAHEVNGIIDLADTSMDEHIAPYIPQVKNVDVAASIQRTVEAWNNNKGNPARNMFYRSTRFDTDEVKNPGRDFPVPLYNAHPDFFSIRDMKNARLAESGGGYDPTMGIMNLPNTKEPYDFLDAICVMHETTHKNQHRDALDRGNPTVNHERYNRAIMDGDSENNGVLEEECEAWANMIELVFARIGFGSHTVDSALEIMGIPAIQRKQALLHQIFTLAQPYYKGGGRKGDKYPPEYVEAVKKKYLDLNVALFVYDDDGFPVPYAA